MFADGNKKKSILNLFQKKKDKSKHFKRIVQLIENMSGQNLF